MPILRRAMRALALSAAALLLTAAAGAAGAYRLGPGDQLAVSVWGEDALTRTVSVRPDGRLSLPFVPELQAAGLTVAELQREVAARVERYVQNATVSVILIDPASYKIYVVGEVVRPGLYQLKSPTTVLQAIALAGGLREFASANRTVVHRTTPAGREVIKVRLRDILKEAALQLDIQLEPDDVVLVP